MFSTHVVTSGTLSSSRPVARPADRVAGDRLVQAYEQVLSWLERVHQRRHLAQLSDHMLKDIGLTRADVEAERRSRSGRHESGARAGAGLAAAFAVGCATRCADARGILLCHCGQCRRVHSHLGAYSSGGARRHRSRGSRGDRLVQKLRTRAPRLLRDLRLEPVLRADRQDRLAIAAGSLDQPSGLEVIGHEYVATGRRAHRRRPARLRRRLGGAVNLARCLLRTASPISGPMIGPDLGAAAPARIPPDG